MSSSQRSKRRCAECAVVVGLFVSGCVGPGSNSGNQGATSKTSLDAAISRCFVATLLAGVLGGVTCAILQRLDENDKKEIKRIEIAAAEKAVTSATVSTAAESYVGSDGNIRHIEATATVTGPAGSPEQATPTPENRKSAEVEPKAGDRDSSTGAGSGARPSSDQVAEQTICSSVETKVSISSIGPATIPPQIYCRSASGKWEARAG